MAQDFDVKDYWRALILYGRNQATYKLALGQSLIELAKEDKTSVSMNELAEKFFNLYRGRVEGEKPQLYQAGRKTAVERAIDKFKVGKYTRDEAIEDIRRNAFRDVIPRFHNLRNIDLPVRFYEPTDDGLQFRNELMELSEDEVSKNLIDEAKSRWDLLEGAFMMHKENFSLHNDIRKFYLEKGTERKDLTQHVSLLNGYQDDICFYCGEKMNEEDIHVDHVIPRQLIQHDEIWNLVLAHGFCNEQKLDAVPPESYVEKLFYRNEFFIASDHPIKNKLKNQMGNTKNKRAKFIQKRYEDAKEVIGYTWEGLRGYNPETDPFYNTFVKEIYN